MGFFQSLKQILHRKPKIEMIQSQESINQSQINQSITKSPEEPSSIELEKDSLQLGIAAGYTGKFIKEIESSLNRIESQMVNKDWFISQFKDIPELINVMKQHEENDQKRFETIQNLLNSLQKTAEKAPEPIRTDLFKQIQTIESQLSPTPKMLDLLNITRELKEISYNDLANKLNITQSALRGLLSLTIRRTNKIRRFEKEGKGWVRFVSD